MSTRSFIGMKYPNSTDVTYIYCHSDGYFSRNGVYLELFYKNPDRVKVFFVLFRLSVRLSYNF